MKSNSLPNPTPGLAALCAVIVAVALTALAPAATTVAVVNGVVIHDTDLFDPTLLDKLPPDRRQKFIEDRVGHAVELELLVQAARRDGLDEAPDHLAAVARLKRAKAQSQLRLLASAWERSVEALQQARDPANVPADAVAACIRESAEKFKDYPANQLDTIVRHQLASERFQQARSTWLQETITKVPVSVNGKRLPDSIMQAAALEFTSLPGAAVAEAAEVHPLWQFVLEAGNIDTDAFPETPQYETPAPPAAGELAAVSLQIGDTAMTFEELPMVQGFLRTPSRAALRNGSLIFNTLRFCILAELAQQAGLDQDPAVQKRLAAGPVQRRGNGRSTASRGMVSEKQMLVNRYLWNVNRRDAYVVGDAEIAAFYEENREQFRSMDAEQAHELVSSMILDQKIAAARAALIDKLKAAAEITITPIE